MKLYIISGSVDKDIKQFINEAVKKLSSEEEGKAKDEQATTKKENFERS